MKKYLLVLCVLLLAVPATANAVVVETNAGAAVGHGMGDPSEEYFNVVWMGPVVKSWNEGETQLSTILRWGWFKEIPVDGLGAKIVLSDVMWKSGDGIREISVLFDVGFMDKYRERKEGDREVAPTIGGGLSLKLTKVISAQGYIEAFHSMDSEWKAVGYFGLSAGTAFSIGGAK